MANTYYDSELTAEEIEEVLEAIAGILSPANNGKVLAISNGKLEARSVQWGGDSTLEPLSVTANGDYYPEAGVDGFDEVHVSVPNSYTASDEGKVVNNGALIAQTARASQITQNGTYDTTLNNEVTVNVSGGGSAIVQPLNATQNGTYNPPSGVDGYAPVTVAVPGGSGPTYYESTNDPDPLLGNVNDLWVKYVHIGSYLHSLGDSVVYFDTGISENNVYGAEFSFIPIASAQSWQIYVSGTSDGFTFGQNDNNVNGAFLRIRGNQKFNSSGILSVGSSNLLSIKNGYIMLNGGKQSTYDDSLSLGAGGRNVWILSAPNSQRKCNVGITELKLYGVNNNLIFHGVVDEQNGQPCIYDRISQNYILPQGSGTLESVQQDVNNFEKLYKKASSGWTDWFLTQ